MRIFYIFILAAALAFNASANCNFEQQKAQYKPALAEQHAIKEYKNKNVYFMSVANGIGPARPGFEDIPASKCLLLETHWKVLWVGADHQECTQQQKLEQQALNYSARFNKKMIELAAKSSDYICNKELQIR